MPDVFISSGKKFFPTKQFKSGDTITIKSYEGYVESNFKYPDGKVKKVNRFMVEYNGGEYQLDMNKASATLLANKFGKDSAGWVNQQAIGEVLRMPNGGQMIEFKPLEWKD